MTVVHPIDSAWLTTGRTGAQNYDEFADDAEITEIIAANPLSALAIEMPHKAPESLDRSFVESLPDALARLESSKSAGAYQPFAGIAVLYRISDGGQDAFGLWCMADTDQISTSADEPGLIIRNEDVFLEKVRERVALFQTLGHLLSPVLLMQTGRGDELHTALAKACAVAGEPFASDMDPAGRTHDIWPLPGAQAQELLDIAGGGDLVVADGNHRSLAAQTGGLQRFLAVVTTPASVAIQPYNRLVRGVSFEGTQSGGRVRVYTREHGLRAIALEPDPSLGFVGNLDHALVERALFKEQLGLDPGDKRITYVGGDYPESWLIGEVDAGRADLAVLIDPVTVPDFIEVNLARQKMPRKSTWFTPKARAGLVLAELGKD